MAGNTPRGVRKRLNATGAPRYQVSQRGNAQIQQLASTCALVTSFAHDEPRTIDNPRPTTYLRQPGPQIRR
jgi:hypothetical protein